MLPTAPGPPALIALVHLAGFGTGAALYAMLGVMAGRTAPAAGPAGARRADRIPTVTAALGVLWNVGALVLYASRDLGLAPTGASGTWLTVLGVAAFAALGFLPAVAVQAAAQRVARRARRLLTGLAFALSGAAAALQAWAAAAAGGVPSAVPSRPALFILSVGYAALLPVLALRLRRQPGGRAPLVMAALAGFAVTAVHLGHHASGESLAAHLLGDHASLPLALVVLYQDYRVAFADVFLKRALTALVLVAAAVAAHLLIVVPYAVPRLASNPADPLGTAWLAAGLGVVLALASPARRGVGALVDRVILRRVDYAALRRALAAAVTGVDSAEAVLDAVAARLAPALLADAVGWTPTDARAVHAAVRTDARGREAAVDVPVADAPGYVLHVAGLRAGRRLLSDDLALAEWAALLAARRIDLVRVAHERFEREARQQEAERLAAEAELRALRAQLNPHFLFNALTTIGYLVQAAPERALATLYELTGLLRAMLRPTVGDAIPLGDEVATVEAYLAIERARFEERLRVVIDVDAGARAVQVPPLLIQPLVENAVKHGIAPLRRGGEVTVWARVEPAGPSGAARGAAARLRVRVRDSGAGADAAELARRRAVGIGLASVERRLERLYGDAATFHFDSRRGEGTTVELAFPVHVPAQAQAPADAAPGVPLGTGPARGAEADPVAADPPRVPVGG